ncbi:hypothetical protein F5146DRAFT_1027197 [Armillaria mellea]|nr:hypothetical protein F5146DRAFT_1027197 [Armillaria mellea]
MKEELETSWSAVMATICSNYPIVELLRQHGVNAKIDSKSSGITALHIPTALGETKLMRLLLQHGVGPNFSHKNRGGSGMIMPLYWAAITSEPSVRLLLEYGPDPKTLNGTWGCCRLATKLKDYRIARMHLRKNLRYFLFTRLVLFSRRIARLYGLQIN